MKKCQGCHQEIDKYTIACQYCGKLSEEREKGETDKTPDTEDSEKQSEEK